MGIREIRNDADVLELALNVDYDRMINVYAKVSDIGTNDSDVVPTLGEKFPMPWKREIILV